MDVSDFTGNLDIQVHTTDRSLRIRTADPRIAVSAVLMNDLRQRQDVAVESGRLVVSGIDRSGIPCQVIYRIAGFDPTAHPEASEGGFHLLERITSTPSGATEQESP